MDLSGGCYVPVVSYRKFINHLICRQISLMLHEAYHVTIESSRLVKLLQAFDLMTTCIPLLKCIHVRSYRRDLVSPYGLDSTSRVALMCVFSKLDHRGT